MQTLEELLANTVQIANAITKRVIGDSPVSISLTSSTDTLGPGYLAMASGLGSSSGGFSKTSVYEAVKDMHDKLYAQLSEEHARVEAAFRLASANR